MNDPKIIFQDENIIVVDKPSGWITNDTSTTNGQPTVQTWIRTNHQSPITNHLEFRDGIVHRLDKETSGILLVAKTESAFRELQRQFKERLVKKTYTALVHGEVKEKEGIINEPVGRLPWRRDRFGVLPDGRLAITSYKVLSRYTIYDIPYTLLELAPKTGRTHQIRIHLKHIGHPIVGDEFYAGRKTARHDRKWCPRLFLHASKIIFSDVFSKSEVEFNSPLPPDLTDILKSI
ncbi:MAG: RluA family pseudouridine synthase [Patescibacteria group bacterium]